MADTKRYQVVAACAVLPAAAADGSAPIQTLYRGAVLEADPDHFRVKHNADSGYIVEIGANATPGVDAAGTPLVDDKPTVGDGNPGDPVVLNDPGVVNEAAHAAVAASADADAKAAEVTAKREAAAAKLPDDGSAPKASNGQDVWVEYLVAKGYDYSAVASQDKEELRKLAETIQS